MDAGGLRASFDQNGDLLANFDTVAAQFAIYKPQSTLWVLEHRKDPLTWGNFAALVKEKSVELKEDGGTLEMFGFAFDLAIKNTPLRASARQAIADEVGRIVSVVNQTKKERNLSATQAKAVVLREMLYLRNPPPRDGSAAVVQQHIAKEQAAWWERFKDVCSIM